MAKRKTKIKLKNHVVFVVDRSGSMYTHQKDVLDSLNGQIKKHKQKQLETEQETKISLTTFSDEVDHFGIYGLAVEKMKDITPNQYVPGGNTALYDAVYNAIRSTEDVARLTGEDKDPNQANLLVVMTDGYENASTTTNDQIRKVIKDALATGKWSLMFCVPPGSKQAVAEDFGTPIGNILEWETSQKGFKEFFVNNTRFYDNFYGARGMSTGVATVSACHNLSAANLTEAAIGNVLTVTKSEAKADENGNVS